VSINCCSFFIVERFSRRNVSGDVGIAFRAFDLSTERKRNAFDLFMRFLKSSSSKRSFVSINLSLNRSIFDAEQKHDF